MSRKKKYKAKLKGVPNVQSFWKIKSFLSNKADVSRNFYGDSSARWSARGDNKSRNYKFPYAIRNGSILDIVGPTLRASFDIKEVLPPDWIKLWVDSFALFEDPFERDVATMFGLLSDDNWSKKQLPRKALAKIRRTHKLKFGTGQSIKNFIIDLASSGIAISTLFKNRLISSLDTFSDRAIKGDTKARIYMSCDPYDIIRMGSGKPDVASCLCISSKNGHGSQSYSVPEYMADPNMFVCYVEDHDEAGGMHSIRSRMIVRTAISKFGKVLIPDRVYGGVEYQPGMLRAIREQAVLNGMKMAWFSSYNSAQRGSSLLSFKTATELGMAYGKPILFRKRHPYFDQSSSAEYVYPDDQSSMAVPSYSLSIEI
jgi:hypothetical protein